MNYYDDKERTSKVYAALAVLCYGVVVAVLCYFVVYPMPQTEAVSEMEIEFVEQPEPMEEPPLPPSQQDSPRHDVHSSEVEQTKQLKGDDVKTTTTKPLPGFVMNNGPDEPEESMAPIAPDAQQELRRGSGEGMNVAGDDALDAGLRGRGVVGNLPQPRYPGDKSGKIVIRVTVDKEGRVTSAEFQAKGSTLSDPAFIQAAKSAALKARFRESSAEIMGGQITYKFNLN